MHPIFPTMGGRKFMMACTAIVGALVMKYTSIDHDTALTIAGIAVSYILGQSACDALSDGKTSSTAQFPQEKTPALPPE